jgi:hypothetical protein
MTTTTNRPSGHYLTIIRRIADYYRPQNRKEIRQKATHLYNQVLVTTLSADKALLETLALIENSAPQYSAT